MASAGAAAPGANEPTIPSPMSTTSRTFRGPYYFRGTQATSGTSIPSTAASFNAAIPTIPIAPLVSLSGPPTYAHSLGVMVPTTPSGTPVPSVVTRPYFLSMDGEHGDIEDMEELFHPTNNTIPFTPKHRPTLGSMANNWGLKENLDIYNDLDVIPERIIRPKLREDIKGASGFWDLFRFLTYSSKEHIGKNLALGHFSTPSVVAGQVMISASTNPTFQALYTAHAASQLAVQLSVLSAQNLADPNGAVTPTISLWNFSRETMLQNPVSNLLHTQVSYVVTEYTVVGMGRFRHFIRNHLSRHTIMGAPALPPSGMGYCPGYIKSHADNILAQIYPVIDSTDLMPEEVEYMKDSALMGFYQSDVMRHAISAVFMSHGIEETAHGLVRTYGPTNIRHANAIAVAAMGIETELLAGGNSVAKNGVNESLWRRAFVFPQEERDLYHKHFQSWKRLRKNGSPFKASCDALLKSRYDELDLLSVVANAQAG